MQFGFLPQRSTTSTTLLYSTHLIHSYIFNLSLQFVDSFLIYERLLIQSLICLSLNSYSL